MSNFSIARTTMIDSQIRPSDVNDPRLLKAIGAVPRENFVPKAKRGTAYVDEDVALGEGRFLMEPMVFARLMDAAAITDSDVVLDIGGATGYSAAVISHLADAVVALESDAAMVTSAEKRLAEIEVVNVAVVEGELIAGVAKQGPFDVIFINGSVPKVPANLTKQLSDGGRLLCVIDDNGIGRARKITKVDGELVEQTLFDAYVEPVPGFEEKASFTF